ncbi:hypothetical protein [Hyphomicrobium sp.]|uniref:hypothetical protein n=1 Tax=Hyphomicrobium sp. TaxID=82 RepID=UPI003569AF06
MQTVATNTPLSEFRFRFPIGSTKYVSATDEQGAYIGLLDVAAVHSENATNIECVIGDLKADLIHTSNWITAPTRFDQLVQLFENQETELLVVVDDEVRKRPVGYITEAFALRRYRQELESRQREIFGSS